MSRLFNRARKEEIKSRSLRAYLISAVGEVFLVVISIPFVGCDSDEDTIQVNLSSFDAITEEYPYQEISLSENLTHWQLVRSFGQSDYEVLYFEGGICEDIPIVSCSEQYNDIYETAEGFAPSCFPALCTSYVIYESQGDINLANDLEGIIEFVGSVDSKSEALLIVLANGYFFSSDDKATGAIKEIDNGYQILATRLVKFCVPVQTNRYLLKVTREGEMTVLQEEVFERNENICI